jgi:serine/threonine protein kinase
LPSQQRAALLEEASRDEPPLRRQVEDLLQAHAESQAFLEHPAQAASPGNDEPEALIGHRLGEYRVESWIGSGGMGDVYAGRREGAASSAGRVALKVLRQSLVSERLLRRFHKEARILSGLEHPGIARLLDGGTSADGRPYFVMEHVDGVAVDEYCDAQGLDVAARLRLFQRVCVAVDYAHRRLVVHRDLKPANILVTGDGDPKLVDFGIAKLLRLGGAGPQLFSTFTALRVMTPDYASPEQLLGEVVTLRSDVYSLGTVLYELLAGRRPHRLAQLSVAKALRIVCRETPAAPSRAAATGRRAVLEGDLDYVVMKALAKDPEARYLSAQLLSEDLERWLVGARVRPRGRLVAWITGLLR